MSWAGSKKVSMGHLELARTVKVLVFVLGFALIPSAFGATGVWLDGDKPAPERPYQKARKGFGVQLQLTKDESFFTAWESSAQPQLEITSTAAGGDAIYSVLLFFGAGKDKKGNSKVTFSGQVVGPNGRAIQKIKDVVALDGPNKGEDDDLCLSVGYARIAMATEGAKGVYSVELTVTDHVKGVSIPLVQKVELK